MRAWGSIGWQLCAPANLGLTLSSLSKLWGPLSVYWYSGLCVLSSPGVLVRSHSLSLSASICVVVWPCLLPHTSTHRISFSFSCLCWHTAGLRGELFPATGTANSGRPMSTRSLSLLSLSGPLVLWWCCIAACVAHNCASAEIVVRDDGLPQGPSVFLQNFEDKHLKIRSIYSLSLSN